MTRELFLELFTGLLREMIRIRRFEEKCVELYSATKIRGFLHLCIGEEAVAVGVVGALSEDDAVVSTYREHGHALARGVPMPSIMAEMFGKATGCSGGRGGSMHLFDASRRFYGGNAIVAGGMPVAVGLALADHLSDDRAVTVCLFGDGAFAEGEFHESANLAALWNLPVLFCCENNRYAMGTALAREHASTDLAMRAAAYGMVAWTVDGMDVIAVREATDRALEYVRDSGKPCFLELRTYRFRAHSMYDPDRYRDKSEIATWKKSDPIPALEAKLVSDGLMTPAEVERWRAGVEAEVDAEIAAAVESADAAPLEPVEDLLRHVTTEAADGVALLAGGRST
ncbi:pyruvate dehydrogenase E1 component alpha subunit [Humibacillus xanthopallidus]|uniref:Pyruvate dehydrogenase E1 component subunit alpha n=1 Tax=Humibacillus xanthopallidus TaxID=412689 RepID=A0A543PPI9_9MICO|nr:pyruvate dehydrogenase (acetyl-transferring) E1 component subunit alpha [Humibacillus xanthopallidus]TQN46002.1 pyruvate dehydrogenase E1 component alpha subunit [Humibacillus xanthopallidus]